MYSLKIQCNFLLVDASKTSTFMIPVTTASDFSDLLSPYNIENDQIHNSVSVNDSNLPENHKIVNDVENEEYLDVEFLNNDKIIAFFEQENETENIVKDPNIDIRCLENSVSHIEDNDALDESKEIYKCLADGCNAVFDEKLKLNRHQRSHPSNIKKHACSYCDQTFSDGSTLTKHMKRHRGDKKFACEFCGMRFYESTILKVHTRTHTGEKPFKCEICGKSFVQSSQLRAHTLIHTGIKSHICGTCNRAFMHPWQLKVHLRTHTNDRPYSCSECGKSFGQSGNLAIHFRSAHTGDRPYHCTEFKCDKRFASQSELRSHLKTHTDEKIELKIECPHCDRKCANNAKLQVHLRTHTGEKPYSCVICFKNFMISSHLIVHMRSHTGERPFSCTYCDKGKFF